MKHPGKYLVLGFLLALSFQSNAQNTTLRLGRQAMIPVEIELNKAKYPVHTAWRPIIRSDIKLERELVNNKDEGWFKRKLLRENFVVIQDEGISATINPLLHLEAGFDLADDTPSRITTNSRGAVIEADIGDKVGLFTSFRENQAFVPDYLNDYVLATDNMPGDGRVKPFKTTGFDYAMASGYVSVDAHEKVNLQFGHDKRFVGDGYRSLLLSDNSFNYPFMQVSTSWYNNRVKLNNMYTSMQSLNRLPYKTTPEALFERKAGTFHHLNFVITDELQLGIFEGTIWQRMDTATLATQKLNPLMINPIPGVGALINGLAGDNNSLLGLTVRYKTHDYFYMYGQYVLDDLNLKKSGWQAGIRGFNLIVPGLHMQAEINRANNYTFSHDIPLQNYGHYNQPLAHPLGAGFMEYVSIIDYNWKSFWVQAKMTFATTPDDQDTLHLGSNIFNSEFDRTAVVIGDPTLNILNVSLDFAYVVNPTYNLELFLTVRERAVMRNTGATGNDWMNYIGFGLRTSLWNTYYDF